MHALVEGGSDVRAVDEQGFSALLNAVKVGAYIARSYYRDIRVSYRVPDTWYYTRSLAPAQPFHHPSFTSMINTHHLGWGKKVACLHWRFTPCAEHRAVSIRVQAVAFFGRMVQGEFVETGVGGRLFECLGL